MNESPLRIRTEKIGRGFCVSLAGELDIATAQALQSALDRTQADRPNLVLIDLRELVFMDSTGLRIVLRAAGRADELGHLLVLVRGPRAVQRVFELAQLDGRLTFVDDPRGVGD